MGDQFGWESILYLVGDQFAKIGRKLGPANLKPQGLEKDFELAGDLFGQFIDQHKVEFEYPHNQIKFEVARADITAKFGAIS